MRSITLSSTGQYVEIVVTGPITRDSAVQINREAHQFGREHGVRHYLMDLTAARNIEPLSRTFDFAHQVLPTTPDVDLTAVVAMLVAPDDHSHDFVETAARNAGRLVTLFRDREQAIAHLVSR